MKKKRISSRQQKIVNVVLQIIAAIRINKITKTIQKENGKWKNQLGTLYVGRKEKFEKIRRIRIVRTTVDQFIFAVVYVRGIFKKQMVSSVKHSKKSQA